MTVSQIYCRLLDSYYGKEKERLEREFLLYRYIYRPCSFPIATLFILMRFSANQVSVLNILVLLMTLLLFAFGGGDYILWAAVSFFLFYVLDFADGNIARFHGTPSYFGKLLDGLIDTLGFLVFAVVGIANADAGLNWLPVAAEVTLAVSTTIGALLHQNYRFRLAYLKREGGFDTAYEAVSPSSLGASPQQWRARTALVAWLRANVAVSTPVALVIFGAFDALSVFISCFFLLHCLAGPAEIFVSLVRNKALMREYRET